jgi:hypothetical protein
MKMPCKGFSMSGSTLKEPPSVDIFKIAKPAYAGSAKKEKEETSDILSWPKYNYGWAI